MHALKADAVQMKEHLLKGQLADFAKVLGRSWEAKKRMAAVISNPEIEAVFAVALRAGALSGKLSGAGGGGFIMFMIDPCKREEISAALAAFGGQIHRFQFTLDGVKTWSIR